eukprot:GHRR01014454.1.p1 GENE.GHRR01014454.1~~GHRR01014454.1.p1  ORF type:complete len:234 (+),score=64.77 GHRR01014454.1:470-1171(+)
MRAGSRSASSLGSNRAHQPLQEAAARWRCDCLPSCSCKKPGVMGARPGPNGRDQHLVVNHLGPFLLTNLLLPHMTAGSRIINVSSRAHKWGHVAVKDNLIQPASNLWFVQYSRSKLCNILFTSELQRRLQQSRGIIATSVSPGFVNTTIYRSLSPSLAWLFCTFAPFLARTPAEGAKVAVFAATTDLLSADRPVPLLLHDCKPMAPKKLAQDSKLAADLWQASATAVGWTEER